MGSKLLKVNQIAAEWGLSKSFLYKIIREGDLQGIRFGTAAIRVREEDLKAYLEACLILDPAMKAVLAKRAAEQSEPQSRASGESMPAAPSRAAFKDKLQEIYPANSKPNTDSNTETGGLFRRLK